MAIYKWLEAQGMWWKMPHVVPASVADDFLARLRAANPGHRFRLG